MSFVQQPRLQDFKKNLFNKKLLIFSFLSAWTITSAHDHSHIPLQALKIVIKIPRISIAHCNPWLGPWHIKYTY